MRVQNSVITLKVSHFVCQESIQEKLFFIKKKYIYFRNRTIRKACSVERFYFEGQRHQILSTDSIGPSTKSANWPCLKVIFLE